MLVWMSFRLRMPARPFSILILLSLLSLAVSTAGSANPQLSVYGTVWRRFGAISQGAVLVFAWTLGGQAAGRPDYVRTVLRGVSVGGFLTALYGIAQYAGWDPVLNPSGYHIGEGIWSIVRPPGTLGYVSYFSAWLVCVVFLSLALARIEGDRWWRCLAVCAAFTSAAATLLTGTRAAVLGLLVGFAVERYQRGTFRVTRRTLAWMGIVAVVSVAFWLSPAAWLLHSRVKWAQDDPWGGARLYLWKDSLRMAMHHPLLGCGPETFQANFPHYESAQLARAYPDFSHESPHNIFLDVLVAQGLAGLLPMLLLCGYALRRPVPWLTAALLGGAVCQQLIVFNLPVALIFYTTIALIVATTSSAVSCRRGPFAAFAVPASVALLYIAVRMATADHALAVARRQIDTGALSSAASSYALYARTQPGPTTADLWFSRAAFDFAQRASNPPARFQAMILAGSASLRSLKTAEDPFNAWYNLAMIWAARNNRTQTEQALRSAIAAHPNWFKPHWTLARLLCVDGRLDEAEHEASLAAYLDNGKHAEVLQALTLVRTLHLASPRSALRK